MQTSARNLISDSTNDVAISSPSPSELDVLECEIDSGKLTVYFRPLPLFSLLCFFSIVGVFIRIGLLSLHAYSGGYWEFWLKKSGF